MMVAHPPLGFVFGQFAIVTVFENAVLFADKCLVDQDIIVVCLDGHFPLVLIAGCSPFL